MSRSRRNSSWEDDFDDTPGTPSRRMIGDESVWGSGEWDEEDDFSLDAGSRWDSEDDLDWNAGGAYPLGR